ncbi:unnamed protein product [Diamesa serratosioi]
MKDLVLLSGFGSTAIVEAIITESQGHIGRLNQSLKKQSNKKNYGGLYLGSNNDKRCTVDQNTSVLSNKTEHEDETPKLQRDYISNPEFKTEITEQMNRLILRNRNGNIPECVSLTNSIRKPMELLILNAVNPHMFWFCVPSNQYEHQELMRNMKEFYTNLSESNLRYDPKEIIKDLYVATKYKGIWHRAKVVSINTQNDVQVYYIDLGIVDDVTNNRHIRYLMPQYMDLPAVAQRGVLSNIQPKGGTWSEDAAQYFINNFTNKTLSGIIFKHNPIDSIYYVALKTQDKVEKLVTMFLLELNYGFIDNDFLNKEQIICKELKFSDYESGTYKSQKLMEIEKLKSVIPVESHQLSASSSETTSFQLFDFYKKYSPNMILNFDTKKETSDDKSSEEAENVSPEENSLQQVFPAPLSSSMDLFRRFQKSFSKLVDSDPIREVSAQDFRKYNYKIKYTISICVIYSLAKFYFYFKDDLEGIRKYLAHFNADYKKSFLKNHSTDVDLKVGDNVVAKVANNFCRGKILELLNDMTFKIFLFDFGGHEVLTKEYIYTMKEEYFQHPPCAYLGKLANIPLTMDPVDLRECFQDEVKDQFQEAQITNIQDTTFELIINVPNDEITINDKLCIYDY